MELEQIIPILQLAIGPVIVISGVGLILLSMTNRFGRVIDRSRNLAVVMRTAIEEEKEGLKCQIEILMRRAYILRRAIALASISLVLAAVLVISLFLVVLMDIEAAKILILLFVLCMGCLIASLFYFIADINVSLSALKVEMDMDIK
jgi:Cu/Ag efflux pump CusA